MATRISAKDVMEDIKNGMSDEDLMKKYGLSSTGLQSLFKKLMDAKVLTSAMLAERSSEFNLQMDVPVAETRLDESRSNRPSVPAQGQSTITGPKTKVMISPKVPPANPFVAGLLNWLWGGAGYFYVGQKNKGIVFAAATLALYTADVLTCGMFLFVHVPVVAALIVDAILVGKRLEKGESVWEWQFF